MPAACWRGPVAEGMGASCKSEPHHKPQSLPWGGRPRAPPAVPGPAQPLPPPNPHPSDGGGGCGGGCLRQKPSVSFKRREEEGQGAAESPAGCAPHASGPGEAAHSDGSGLAAAAGPERQVLSEPTLQAPGAHNPVILWHNDFKQVGEAPGG